MQKFGLFLVTKWLSLFIVLTLFNPLTSNAQLFNIITYNIRYDNPADGLNNWSYRKQDVIKLIEQSNPIAFGIQEGLAQQVAFIDSNLINYKYTGVGRDDGNTKGEYAAIFFDTTRIKLIAGNTFWLSETPDTVSTGWDAALPRICTYGLFQTIDSGKQFYVFNTHFDHVGLTARNNSAKLILQKINLINTNNLPLILLGDFNCEPTSEPIQTIAKQLYDAQIIAQQPFTDIPGTFNGFDIQSIPEKRIDYIFVIGFEVIAIKHLLNKTEKGLWVSDHLPVEANVVLR